MFRSSVRVFFFSGALFAAPAAHAQVTARVDCAALQRADHATMDHADHMKQMAQCAAEAERALPTQAGQATFAALGEVVKLLDADPSTDWSKVNLEALRQHLIDMNDVTMRARVRATSIAGGFTADVTGTGTTVGAIQRMLGNHARMLEQGDQYHAAVTTMTAGVRLRVTVRDPNDARAVARLRGLGVAGLITEGTHHMRHHLAIARGDAMPHDH